MDFNWLLIYLILLVMYLLDLIFLVQYLLRSYCYNNDVILHRLSIQMLPIVDQHLEILQILANLMISIRGIINHILHRQV